MDTPTQPENLKQYFVLTEVKLDAFHILRANTVVMLDPAIAEPLIAADLICPLFSAIKRGLYPPKEEKNIIEQVVEKVQETIEEAKTEVAEAVAPANAEPPKASPLVEQLKENTQKHNTRSVAFENALKKKIQEKKKNAKQSSS